MKTFIIDFHRISQCRPTDELSATGHFFIRLRQWYSKSTFFWTSFRL